MCGLFDAILSSNTSEEEHRVARCFSGADSSVRGVFAEQYYEHGFESVFGRRATSRRHNFSRCLRALCRGKAQPDRSLGFLSYSKFYIACSA